MPITRKHEEIFNSLSHAVGFLVAIVGTVILIIRSAIHGNAWHIVSFSIFGAGMINLYLASALFHGAQDLRKKSILNKFDHSSIYVLIAATYTPLALVTLNGTVGWIIFGMIWLFALLGLTFKIFFYSSKYRKLSAWLYFAMGWFFLVAIYPLAQNLPTTSFILLIAGCVTYSTGILFYLKRGIPFGHGIFHLFIIGGTTCHFFTIFFLL
ncbi:MAG: hemolysin III family protein [Bacteroidales bacterium]|nr:hemolysin III family protein [Bacteroidales bacterium]MBN2749128.1 hemolysin III family protein [Bacteroidales bacterium]